MILVGSVASHLCGSWQGSALFTFMWFSSFRNLPRTRYMVLSGLHVQQKGASPQVQTFSDLCLSHRSQVANVSLAKVANLSQRIEKYPPPLDGKGGICGYFFLSTAWRVREEWIRWINQQPYTLPWDILHYSNQGLTVTDWLWLTSCVLSSPGCLLRHVKFNTFKT